MQCSSQVFECRTFPTAVAKSQSQKLTLLAVIRQTLVLPGYVSTGKTREDAERNMRGAIEFHIDGLQEEGVSRPGTTGILVLR